MRVKRYYTTGAGISVASQFLNTISMVLTVYDQGEQEDKMSP